jgi:hypothetical protein
LDDAETLSTDAKDPSYDTEARQKVLGNVDWSDTVTVLMCDNFITDNEHRGLSYCLKRLPKHLPNLAGMYAMVCGRPAIACQWSDNSRMMRSGMCFYMDGIDQSEHRVSSWMMISSFLYTLYRPKEGLPCWDSTMKKEGDQWNLETSELRYTGKTIYTACHQSKHTCVFDSKKPERIIKDIWVNNDHSEKEDEMLETAKGIPGVIQIDHSEKVSEYKVDLATGERTKVGDLETSALSGEKRNIRHLMENRRTPFRTKWRHVYRTKGKPLSMRKNVRQILKALFDALQGMFAFTHDTSVSNSFTVQGTKFCISSNVYYTGTSAAETFSLNQCTTTFLNSWTTKERLALCLTCL